MMKKILYPLKYLTLYNKFASGEVKKYTVIRLDSLWVGVSLIICIVMFLLLPFNIFGKDGIINNLSNFISTLVGFYIAALGIVATFNGNNLSLDDDIITQRGGKLCIKDNGEDICLTRRSLVCLMLGYLSFFSIIFYLSAIFAINIAYILKQYLIIHHCFIFIKFIAIIYFFSLFSHLILTALRSIYYLIYKIHEKKVEFL